MAQDYSAMYSCTFGLFSSAPPENKYWVTNETLGIYIVSTARRVPTDYLRLIVANLVVVCRPRVACKPGLRIH